MNRSTTIATPRQRLAVTAVFAANGMLFASLFARLPEIQERLRLSEGALGLALLAAPVGLVGAVWLAGAGVRRYGSRRVSALGIAGYAGLLWLPAVSPTVATLAGALFVIGAASGTLDVAMNTQGIAVDRLYPRRIFASFHAAFSFGALGGAALAGLMAHAGVPLELHLAGVGAVLGLALIPAVSAFVPDRPEPSGEAGATRWSRRLITLGFVSLCALLAEGALNDWSAVYLARELDSGPAIAAGGLAAFSLAMGIGRLAGDPLAARLGSVALMRAGLLLSAAGFAVAAAVAAPVTAMLAFVVLGLGLAAVYPLALRAAAGPEDVSTSGAIVAVTTLGYLGFLAGPPAVGLLAQLASLRTSLVAIGALCVLAAVAAGTLGAPARAARAGSNAGTLRAAARAD